MTIAIGEGMSAADAIVAAIPALKRYAVKLARNLDVANDMVQDTLVRALAKQHQFHLDTGGAAPWLRTILQHHYVDQVRRWAANPASPTSDGELPPVGASPVQDKRGLIARDLNRALAALPEQERQAVVLVGANDMTCVQAAKAMGVPRSTAQYRLSRGRKALRHLMDGEISA